MKNFVQRAGAARGSLLVLFLLLYPLTVFAHQRGGEVIGFASGVEHPISGLDHILAMVAVGMWGTQLGAPAIWVLPVVFPMVMALGGMMGLMGIKLPGIELCIALSALALGFAVLFALPVAWLVGSAAGPLLAQPITLPLAETVITIALGALLAADRPLPLAPVAGLAILLGLLHGILNGSELPKASSSGQISAVGVAAALFVAVSLLAGQAASVRVLWARVAVRVAGSWIVAIGLLMLGWAMRVPG